MTATRRSFLKSTTVATGGVFAANLNLLANVHAAGEDIIRVGLIGCGGRGSGAIEQCIRGGRNVRVVAVGDVFRDRAENVRNSLRNLAQRTES
ncbi:MAG: twin-arginine translocation signal domain-containing protein, partial [Gemmataceae bacterium]|nr:twin-arginine translocation signal domain-containing protein [Gemmataceae bacterium]